MWAIVEGSPEIALALLKSDNIRVNAADNCMNTALHFCCMQGLEVVANALLAREGIDRASKNSYGWTPVHCASRGTNVALLKTMLEASKGVVDEKTLAGYKAIHIAIQENSKQGVRAILEAKGIMRRSKQEQ